MKPTYGSLSRWGLIAYASSLDTPGIFTKSVGDAELVFGLLNHHDPKDPTSIPDDARRKPTSSALLKGLVVGVPREYLLQELDSEIVELWSRAVLDLAQKGATIKPVSLPHTKDALPAYYILATSEASSNLARYDGIRFGSLLFLVLVFGCVFFFSFVC